MSGFVANTTNNIIKCESNLQQVITFFVFFHSCEYS